MLEKLKRADVRRNTAALIATLGLVAACDGTTVNAAKTSLRTCDSDSYIFNKGSANPAPSADTVMAEANGVILLLQQRALANGGELNLTDHWTTEIKATSQAVDLIFPPSRVADLPGETDTLHFDIKDGKAQMVAASLLCSSNRTIYTNSAYRDMENYLKETAILSSQQG